jgi:hypothetical protein
MSDTMTQPKRALSVKIAWVQYLWRTWKPRRIPRGLSVSMARAVGTYLAFEFSDADGRGIRPSAKRIADGMTDIKERQAKSYRSWLKEEGLIVQYASFGRVPVFTLNLPSGSVLPDTSGSVLPATKTSKPSKDNQGTERTSGNVLPDASKGSGSENSSVKAISKPDDLVPGLGIRDNADDVPVKAVENPHPGPECPCPECTAHGGHYDPHSHMQDCMICADKVVYAATGKSLAEFNAERAKHQPQPVHAGPGHNDPT